jgi:tetratricopeptide (TPR) repeat protein
MKLNYFILVIAAACLSACSVSYVPLTVQRAPEIAFGDSLTNVLVINRFDARKVDFLLRKEKKKEVYARGINAEIGQLLNELESMKGINLIKKSDSLTMARNIKANLDSTVLTVGEIEQLASKYQADYILALENYDASFVQDEIIRSKNNDGSTKKVARYSLAIQSSWVLYDKHGRSFKELRGNVAKYHSQREVLSGLLAIGPALGSNTKFVQEVSIDAGKHVSDYFKGQLISIMRPLYTDKNLKTSATAIRSGDYVKAQNELEALTKVEDNSIASKAYYNLAVIADLKGNRKSAIDFAELSLQKKKNMYASMMLNGFKYGG